MREKWRNGRWGLWLLFLFGVGLGLGACGQVGDGVVGETAVPSATPMIAAAATAVSTGTAAPSLTPAPTRTPSPMPTVIETGTPPPSVTPSPAPTATPVMGVWGVSRLRGELEASYPLTAVTDSGRITLHYQPDTFPAQNLALMRTTADGVLTYIEGVLGGEMPAPIDLYLGGTLLETPGLFGLAESWQYRAFVRVDGAHLASEWTSFMAHELTHVAATHILGPASSPMVHEGLAMRVQADFLAADAARLPGEMMCAALVQAGVTVTAVDLSRLSYGTYGFGGPNSFTYYHLSGCFVAYLLATYGWEAFAEVFVSGDFEEVTGRSLTELDAAWRESLRSVRLPFVPEAYLAALGAYGEARRAYLAASGDGRHADWGVYLTLVRVGRALNRFP